MTIRDRAYDVIKRLKKVYYADFCDAQIEIEKAIEEAVAEEKARGDQLEQELAEEKRRHKETSELRKDTARGWNAREKEFVKDSLASGRTIAEMMLRNRKLREALRAVQYENMSGHCMLCGMFPCTDTCVVGLALKG